MNKRLWVSSAALSITMLASSVNADTVLDYLTDFEGKYMGTNIQGQYIGPSLEDNVRRMDADKNGFADVFEVRAFLELQHGTGYEKELLDKWEASASGKSCSTPFAKELYSDKTN